MIELRHLRQFVAVVETGGIRQASRTVHLSASSVLRSVQLLEDHYGVKLLERDGRAMSTTPFGAQLLDEARTVLAAFDGISPRLEQLEQADSGTLRVGVSPPIADSLLPRVASRLVAESPAVDLRVQIGAVDEVLTPLLEQRTEVAVAYEKLFRLQKDLQVTPLYADTVGWWGRKDHPLCRKKKLTMKDMAGYPLLSQHLPPLYEGYLQDIMATASEEARGARMYHAHRCNNYGVLVRIACETDAILMAPNLSILGNTLGKGLRRLSFPLDMPEAPFAIAYPHVPSPSPLALRFVALMQEETEAMIREAG